MLHLGMGLPFEYGEVVQQSQFINRDKDRLRLSNNLKGGLNTMLISPRRWGKSSLVKQVALESESSQYRFCFIDLFHIQDEQEFYETLAREVIRATSNRMDEWMEIAKSFFTRIHPKITVSTANLNMQVHFDKEDLRMNYREILDLPEKIGKEKGIRMIICLDEFQNLSRFNDPILFQNRLRASWQHHKNVSYCLYGSKRHMMIDIFQNKSMPFYKFGDVMFLEKITTDHWLPFICNQFAGTNRKISKKLAKQIVETVKNHSYYVQQLSHLVWIRTDKTANEKILQEAITDLLNQNSMLYAKDMDDLSRSQVNFLKALTNKEEELHSGAIIAKYDLGSSSNVSRVKEALFKKEIIDDFNGQIEFLDPAFELWFRRLYGLR